MLESLRALPPATPLLSDGSRVFDAAETVARVMTLENSLAAHGGTRYALLADNGPDWIIADLALLKLERFNVPVPGYFTARQLHHVLTDSGIDRILTDEPERLCHEMPDLKVLGGLPGSSLTLLSRPVAGTPVPAPAGTVKVTYTSGSTGQPKGVCLRAAGQMTVGRTLATLSPRLGLKRHLCLLPLPTLLENLAGVYAPLLAGTQCIAPPLKTVGMSYGQLDAQQLLGAITRYEPDSLILVPELLRVLVMAAEKGWKPPSLTFLAVGGASVPRDLLVRAHAAGLPAYEGYGLTECTSVVSLNLPGAMRLGSAGRPLPHVSVRIDGHGEIHVRGALLLGFLGTTDAAPEEVATGDLGELDNEGFLYVKGRLKNLFITSLGRNVSPEWIESTLLQQAAIGQAVVWGEGLPHPAAIIVPAHADSSDATLSAAIAKANHILPDYARIDQWVRADRPFAYADGLLTANGRPRRDAIVARYARDAATPPLCA